MSNLNPHIAAGIAISSCQLHFPNAMDLTPEYPTTDLDARVILNRVLKRLPELEVRGSEGIIDPNCYLANSNWFNPVIRAIGAADDSYLDLIQPSLDIIDQHTDFNAQMAVVLSDAGRASNLEFVLRETRTVLGLRVGSQVANCATLLNELTCWLDGLPPAAGPMVADFVKELMALREVFHNRTPKGVNVAELLQAIALDTLLMRRAMSLERKIRQGISKRHRHQTLAQTLGDDYPPQTGNVHEDLRHIINFTGSLTDLATQARSLLDT